MKRAAVACLRVQLRELLAARLRALPFRPADAGARDFDRLILLLCDPQRVIERQLNRTADAHWLLRDNVLRAKRERDRRQRRQHRRATATK